MATPDFVLSAPLLHVSSFITLSIIENEIGHPDLIPEIEDSQERIVLQSETCNALPEVHIFMVELQYAAFTCFLCG